jgi:catalase
LQGLCETSSECLSSLSISLSRHHFNAYGAHTFRWSNKEGKAVYIKYHWLAEHGTKQFNFDEALVACGEDPDYAKRDLFE